jgi:hypothetical protein
MVMSDGQIAGMLEPHEFSEERILRLAVLGRAHEERAPSDNSADSDPSSRRNAGVVIRRP